MDKNLNSIAFKATLHCLSGCALGEVLGMFIGTALHWSNLSTILLAVGLAFFFGYSFTTIPLLRAGMNFKEAAKIALAADTISITIMEIVDNGIILLVPGAIHAHVDELFFWVVLAIALVIAGMVAYPVNRWLISRNKGHALVHSHHH